MLLLTSWRGTQDLTSAMYAGKLDIYKFLEFCGDHIVCGIPCCDTVQSAGRVE